MSKKGITVLEKAFCISVISTLFFFLSSVSFLSPIVNKVFGRTNIPAMALSILLYLLLFLLLRNKEIRFTKTAVCIIFLSGAAFLLASYALEKNVYNAEPHLTIEQSLPWYILIPVIITSFCFLCFILTKDFFRVFQIRILSKSSSLSAKWFIIAAGVFLIALSVYNQYSINFSYYYDYYNIHAYTNSILNLFWGQPFSKTLTSIYGHYAFFYYPVIKLLYSCGIHNIYKIIILINCFLTAASLLIWIIIILRNIKSRLIQFLGIFMVCYFNTSRVMEIYQQVHPHRVFPIAVTALMIALWFRLKNKRTIVIILGYMMCAAILIWNTESGIFSTVSWSALQICSALQLKSKNKWLLAVFHFAAIPVVFLAAVCLCGFLNMLFGGEMIPLQDFIFPISSADYMNLIQIPLQNYPSVWISVMVLFLSFLGYGIKDTVLYSQNYRNSDQTAACFALIVLGLGSFSYAINRPAYCNFYIILPIAALLISIIADTYSSERRNLFSQGKNLTAQDLFRGFSGLLSVTVLIFIFISSLINIPNKLKASKYYKNTEQIEEVQNWIISQHNKDAVALGNSPFVFYSWLGWDPGLYYMDTADYRFVPNAYDDLFQTVGQIEDKSAFISRDIKYLLPEKFFLDHKMPSIFETENFIIEYWTPKDQGNTDY